MFTALPVAAQRGSVGVAWLSGGAAAPAPLADRVDAAARPADLPDDPDAAMAAISAASTFRPGSSLMRAIISVTPHRIAQALRDLVASVEADHRGYDTIHQSAKRLPKSQPTQMTLAEIRKWIKDTPGQQHAIGRYQVIPATLDALADRMGLPPETRFTPAVQDRMADVLLEDAGMSAMVAGEMGREEFLDGLARIWAGLPAASGRSVYHGIAGNKAVISRDRFREKVLSLLSNS